MWKLLKDNSSFITETDRTMLAEMSKYYNVISTGLVIDEAPLSKIYKKFSPYFLCGIPIDTNEYIFRVRDIAVSLNIAIGSINPHQSQVKFNSLTSAAYKLIDNEWYYQIDSSISKECAANFNI